MSKLFVLIGNEFLGLRHVRNAWRGEDADGQWVRVAFDEDVVHVFEGDNATKLWEMLKRHAEDTFYPGPDPDTFDANEWSKRWRRDVRQFAASVDLPIRLHNSLLRVGNIFDFIWQHDTQEKIPTEPFSYVMEDAGVDAPYPEFAAAVVDIISGRLHIRNIGKTSRAALAAVYQSEIVDE